MIIESTETKERCNDITRNLPADSRFFYALAADEYLLRLRNDQDRISFRRSHEFRRL
jgi:hypothetical protein